MGLETTKIVSIGNHTVVFDEEGYNLFIEHKYKWSVIWDNNAYYLRSKVYINDKRVTITFHRHFMKCPKGLIVDHINGNTLDNRRTNLRICNNQQNSQNRHSITGRSKYKGVYITKNGTYRAMIRVNKIKMHIGCFKNEDEAAKAYNAQATIHHGEYAKLNHIGVENGVSLHSND